jgi:hypothetical protein
MMSIGIAGIHRSQHSAWAGRYFFRLARVAACLATVAACLSVFGQDTPRSFNYQGQLKAGDGGAVAAGSYELTFRIYDLPTGGNYLWAVQKTVLVDGNGLFNVELEDPTTYTAISNGSATPQYESLVDALVSGSSRFLEIQVGTSNPIRPRQQLLSVPYAMLAGDVRNASGSFTVAGTLEVQTGAAVTGELRATKFTGIGIVPIGSIIAWHRNGSGAATLSQIRAAGFAVCDGSSISSQVSEAAMTGNTPNLNGQGRFLRGSATSGTMQADSIKSHTHPCDVAEYGTPDGDGTGERRQASRTTSSTGDTETRPVNMSVVWIMRVK